MRGNDADMLCAMASPTAVTEGIRLNTVGGTTLSRAEYLAHFEADFARLRELALSGNRPVPTCPGWSTVDLADHVARVYYHQAFVVKNGRKPEDGEHLPEFVFQDSPTRFLGQAFDALRKALDPTRSPDREVWTWDPASNTVDFWFRRMAHETLIHRFDAEVALGATTELNSDVSLDGVDEVLSWLPLLPEWANGRIEPVGPVTITIDGSRPLSYSLNLTAHTCEATVAPTSTATPAVRIIGAAPDVNLFIWGRMPITNRRLIVDGEAADVTRLVTALRALTQ